MKRQYSLGLYEKAMPAELTWKEKLEAAKAAGYDFVEISVDENIEYFLQRPYGNHHVIIYGDHKQEIIDYMNKIK